MAHAYLWIALLLISFRTWASPAEERQELSIPILDSAQSLFNDRANFVANRLDSFFATQRADDELGRSVIRLRTRSMIRERSEFDNNYQTRFNLRLPHLEEKFHINYFEEKKKVKEGKDPSEVENPSQKKVETAWIFRSDLGVSASFPPRVVVRGRLRKSFETGQFIHRFVEELSWLSEEDWIERTEFDSDYPFSEDLLFRFQNVKIWELIPKTIRTSHGPTLFKQLSESEAVSFNARVSTFLDNGVWFLDNYTLSLDYRKDIYKGWIFVDLIPGIDFPKEWSFRRTPFFMVQLEALFGGTR